jgi:hypothetical protein
LVASPCLRVMGTVIAPDQGVKARAALCCSVSSLSLSFKDDYCLLGTCHLRSANGILQFGRHIFGHGTGVAIVVTEFE